MPDEQPHDAHAREAMLREFPDARAKTILLGSLGRGGELEIADPFRKGARVFRATYTPCKGLQSGW